MVFSYRPPKKRIEIKLFTRESPQQAKEEREIFWDPEMTASKWQSKSFSSQYDTGYNYGYPPGHPWQ
jgi:hypothetical protein